MTRYGRFIAIETLSDDLQKIQRGLQDGLQHADVVIVATPSSGDLGVLQQARTNENPNWLERIYGGLADLHDFAECEGGILSYLEQGRHVICIGYRHTLGAMYLPDERQLDWYRTTAMQLPQPDASVVLLPADVSGAHVRRLQQLAAHEPNHSTVEFTHNNLQPLIAAVELLLPAPGGSQ
ncbi:MAG: hypothetical protein H6670_08235 [Anaerolineaceae bacterium]|nr:hypothetical protein [Anaerolineaceae bacterium]